MERLLFGVSGLPLGDGRKFTQATGIAYLAACGLDAMELLFVRSVNVSDKNKQAILDSRTASGMYLSAHGSYYINLNARDPATREASLKRIMDAAEALGKVNGRSLVFHPGFYLGDSPEETYAAIRDSLRTLPDIGIDYRLESTGKPTQFGTLEELVALSKDVPTCKPCIDFAHIHARTNGGLKSYDDFALHPAIRPGRAGPGRPWTTCTSTWGGIAYGQKGEKHHLPLLDSDFEYLACLRALKDFQAKGCVICEGPRLEHDAVLLKRAYASL